jgi:DnaJ-class molecular chaperone
MKDLEPREWGEPCVQPCEFVPPPVERTSSRGSSFCEECEGEGVVPCSGYYGIGSRTTLESPDEWEETCPACNGTGQKGDDDERA